MTEQDKLVKAVEDLGGILTRESDIGDKEFALPGPEYLLAVQKCLQLIVEHIGEIAKQPVTAAIFGVVMPDGTVKATAIGSGIEIQQILADIAVRTLKA